MIYSIYHFFHSLVENKKKFKTIRKLDKFPFEKRLLSCRNDEEEKEIRRKLNLAFTESELKQFNIFKIKHHFNGHFLVLQTTL